MTEEKDRAEMASAPAPTTDVDPAPEREAPRPRAFLVGFVAVSPSAGQRSGPFPGRMIAFPVMPGFDDTGPRKDLEARLQKEGGWVGYALLVDAEGNLYVERRPEDLSRTLGPE